MALETPLKGIEGIGGFSVIDMEELKNLFPLKFNVSGAMDYQWFEKDIRPNYFIYVRHDVNSISFTIQNGPFKEVGINGCEVDTLIEAAKIMIEGLNKNFPCTENEIVIEKLNDALAWLGKRKKDREQRNVEGFSKA